ncbi:MAG: hypothetical protein HZA51_00845 [Planctomycetes bacterium]|nr:hypothetical protein [Planctomycetota bacterium]
MTGIMQQLLNILIPGAGLIIRCREWLGFSLALIFAICGNIAVAGWLIAPAALPGWFTWLASMLTLFAWCLAQVLFWKQGAALVRQRARREQAETPSETAGVLRA